MTLRNVRPTLGKLGITDVINHKELATVISFALDNCECSREAKAFSYELATKQHGNLMNGIPNTEKVRAAIDYFKSEVDERIYGQYLKSSPESHCGINLPYIPRDTKSNNAEYGARLDKLYQEDWTKANAFLSEICGAIDAGANEKGGGACEAIELLMQALETIAAKKEGV